MKIALAQINPTVGDFTGNLEKIVATTKRAADRGARLAVFSELAICGYPPADFLEKPSFLVRCREAVSELARATRNLPTALVVGVALPARPDAGKPAVNSAVLLDSGQVLLEQHKRLLPFYDVFDEQRYFLASGPQQVVELDNLRLAITICEDAWNDKNFWVKPRYARDPVTELIQQGTSLLINISASPYTLDKRSLRIEMLRSIAQQHRRPVIYVNQVGGDDSLIFDGASMALTPDGRIAAQAKAFEEDIVLFDTATEEGEIHPQAKEEIAYAYQALVLGTRDYVCKCKFSKTIVGLSGGVDSALVAAIAVDALGKENVLGVSMPGPYSSEGSKADAQCLAHNLGIEFLTIPIASVFDSYIQALKPVFAHRPVDATEENIQARIRGNYLMALSNKLGAMVLSTGNKSESAVGYCTLYGDMAGGLALISDVPKLMVYELAEYVNRDREVIPRSTLEKPPSAELRPNQKDSDSLPPYEVLDRVLKAYIEEVKTPAEIAEEFGFDLQLVRNIAQMVDRNEYKRKQAAPGLKITSRAFGFGRPFPIAQRFIP